ncbi:MAG TPA: hypothetical protein GX734_05040 [Clostridiaceae bacterium]|jgi:hypothetical protein|nr:hypothetical protein [Clostridiaceae bacterium]
METKVTTIYDYKNIEIPKSLIELKLPPIDAFIEEQCRALAEKHSKLELPEGQAHVLTDEMVQAEELSGVTTVEEYKDALRREIPLTIKSQQSSMIVSDFLVPQLVQRSTFEINDEEATRESKHRLDLFEKKAKEQGLSLEEYGQKEFGVPTMDEGEVRQYVLYLGRSSFLFRVLAQEYLKQKGMTLDVVSYVEYVKSVAEATGMEEDNVRELIPIHIYMNEVPTVSMLDEMAAWVYPQITFVE